MSTLMSPGARFRQAVNNHNPLQIVGTINAYSALLAQKAGHQVIYLSGAGVANASFGLPDLAMTTLTEVCEDIRRITSRVDLPLLVDADTGWGGAFMVSRTVSEMIRAGAAGCHIEDQVQVKRCGHRPGKALVSQQEMCDRMKAAVDGRTDENFVIMARTDAAGIESLDSAIERAQAYVESGADMIFAEAITRLEDYQSFCKALDVPVLANITEFGQTPIFNVNQLAEQGIKMVLYPLSASRAMAKVALTVYQEIAEQGSQQGVIDLMQTRKELYEVLGYMDYEQKLDKLFEKEGK
ncbi:MAG: methylisocitrate lyase [bacterium]